MATTTLTHRSETLLYQPTCTLKVCVGMQMAEISWQIRGNRNRRCGNTAGAEIAAVGNPSATLWKCFRPSFTDTQTDTHPRINSSTEQSGPLKIYFKNRRWQTASTLDRPILHHREISQFFQIFKMAAVRHFGFLKLKFSAAMLALHRHVLHHRAKFCGDRC